MVTISTERLRRGMAEKGLTVSEVAKHLGVGEGTVRGWIRGAYIPRIGLWPRLEMLIPDVIVDKPDNDLPR